MEKLFSPLGLQYGDWLENTAGVSAPIGLQPFAGSDASVRVVAEVQALDAAALFETDAISAVADVSWALRLETTGKFHTSTSLPGSMYNTSGLDLKAPQPVKVQHLPYYPKQTLTLTGTVPPGTTYLSVVLEATIRVERNYAPAPAPAPKSHIQFGGRGPKGFILDFPTQTVPIARLLSLSVDAWTTTP